MKLLNIFIPLILGFATIIQATLNKQAAKSFGLTQVAVITNAISFSISITLLFLVIKYPDFFPDIFKVKKIENFNFLYILPGIFGISIVIGIPWAISNLGAVKVTILLITAQIISSFAWDIFVENIPTTTNKLIGSLLAFISIIIMSI